VEAKPPQWSDEYGQGFDDPDVADAYLHRPPYPPEAIELLVRLVRDRPRNVLDVGCGPGDLARRLAPYVDRVDAVDPSAAMLAVGRRLTNNPNVHWQHDRAETATLTPPYALITAGESLHWMDWPVVLARFASVLTPHGVLAIVEREWDGPPALRERLRPIFARYSTIRDYRPLDVVSEIERRGLFTRMGERRCGPQAWRPTVAEYLEARHSQRGFHRANQHADHEAFDDAIRQALQPRGDRLELTVEARVVWGRPQPGRP
jgi:SAM-dependent methyltransferase